MSALALESMDSANPAFRDIPLVVICGPSGVGKGTLIGRLQTKFPGSFGFSVSHTTRAPRKFPDGRMETNGVEYWFTDRETMSAAIKENKFLETANVFGLNMYGTSFSAILNVLRQKQIPLLDIDIEGAKQIKTSPVGPSAHFIFIEPPDINELERRLRGRGTESGETLNKRLETGRKELEFVHSPEGNFFQRLVNDDLDQTTENLCTLVQPDLDKLQDYIRHHLNKL